ncbi:hypothetical protein F2981_32770 (plasmid) [Sinorhizobium meliloti]|nr:hypothetical protein [Sinorhizobium meliloti]
MWHLWSRKQRSSKLAGAGGGAIPPIEPPLEPPAPPPPPQNPFEFMGELETMGGELQGQVNQVYAQVQPYMDGRRPRATTFLARRKWRRDHNRQR